MCPSADLSFNSREILDFSWFILKIVLNFDQKMFSSGNKKKSRFTLELIVNKSSQLGHINVTSMERAFQKNSRPENLKP